MKKIKGTGVAIVTPFKNDSSIDFAALGVFKVRWVLAVYVLEV